MRPGILSASLGAMSAVPFRSYVALLLLALLLKLVMVKLLYLGAIHSPSPTRLGRGAALATAILQGPFEQGPGSLSSTQPPHVLFSPQFYTVGVMSVQLPDRK